MNWRTLLARHLRITIGYRVLRWRAGCWESWDSMFETRERAEATLVQRHADNVDRTDLRWCVSREVTWEKRYDEPAPALPANGETRLVDCFLWFPLTIKGERRWLERVQYTQVCQYNEAVFGWTEAFDWVDLAWVG